MSRGTHDATRQREASLLFILGPAGVGKSTCGALLAQELGFFFVDLDSEFNRRIGEIQRWIENEGYLAYCRRNTRLFHDLVESKAFRTVYAISSGFLLYDELDPGLASNASILERLGVSILLLPSKSLSESTEIVVARLVERRPWLDSEKEARKFAHRFQRYQQYGDIKVFSKAGPKDVALLAKTIYLEYLQTSPELNAISSTVQNGSANEDATDID